MNGANDCFYVQDADAQQNLITANADGLQKLQLTQQMSSKLLGEKISETNEEIQAINTRLGRLEQAVSSTMSPKAFDSSDINRMEIQIVAHGQQLRSEMEELRSAMRELHSAAARRLDSDKRIGS